VLDEDPRLLELVANPCTMHFVQEIVDRPILEQFNIQHWISVEGWEERGARWPHALPGDQRVTHLRGEDLQQSPQDLVLPIPSFSPHVPRTTGAVMVCRAGVRGCRRGITALGTKSVPLS
jgi:hypothetical protein